MHMTSENQQTVPKLENKKRGDIGSLLAQLSHRCINKPQSAEDFIRIAKENLGNTVDLIVNLPKDFVEEDVITGYIADYQRCDDIMEVLIGTEASFSARRSKAKKLLKSSEALQSTVKTISNRCKIKAKLAEVRWTRHDLATIPDDSVNIVGDEPYPHPDPFADEENESRESSAEPFSER